MSTRLAIPPTRRLPLGGRFRRPTGSDELIERIRAQAIGDETVLEGPFGPRRMVYADATASGRSLAFVEDFIREHVLTMYGNTHTEASATGRRMTELREQARSIVHRAVNGGDDDVVVFCGAGATGAIDKLMRVLDLRRSDRPVVFLGPYEHHSNELPWRESGAEVVVVGGDRDGRIDLEHLEHLLRRHGGPGLRIGSFSAASNVTGITTDVDGIAMALHRHGALSFWDYAAAGPYLPVDMNAAPDVPDGHLAYKDAVFLSPHKFPGGPGTPGVLVAKRALLRTTVPSVPGGGTILFVSPTRQSYHPEPTVREEAGTPAIVESIRAGMAFALKEAVGTDEIVRREHDFARRALRAWSAEPNLEILGSVDRERLAIVSLGVRHGDGSLHGNLVTAVLNDLFGIQARSGCFCAGPYLHRIYPVDERWSRHMHVEALRGHLGAKLAFTRLTFSYFLSEAAFRYLVEAVRLVARDGWRLLPLYRFDPASGLWEHRAHAGSEAPSLRDAVRGAPAAALPTAPERALGAQLERGRDVLRELARHPPAAPPTEAPLAPGFELARWFPLPSEGGLSAARSA